MAASRHPREVARQWAASSMPGRIRVRGASQESQSVATRPGTMGRMYANHREMGCRILFFTRIRIEVTSGMTSPFLFPGCGNFLDVIGERPISIRWELDHPMPMAHFREARTVCGLDS